MKANFDEKASLPLVAGVQGELRLVLSNCAHHGALPLQEMLAEFIRDEEIVTRDIVLPQSICHIKHNPHPLVLLWASPGWLPCVDLHHPRVMPDFSGLLGISCQKGQRPFDKRDYYK